MKTNHSLVATFAGLAVPKRRLATPVVMKAANQAAHRTFNLSDLTQPGFRQSGERRVFSA